MRCRVCLGLRWPSGGRWQPGRRRRPGARRSPGLKRMSAGRGPASEERRRGEGRKPEATGQREELPYGARAVGHPLNGGSHRCHACAKFSGTQTTGNQRPDLQAAGRGPTVRSGLWGFGRETSGRGEARAAPDRGQRRVPPMETSLGTERRKRLVPGALSAWGLQSDNQGPAPPPRPCFP